MADSLLLTPDIELLAGGIPSLVPACAGATFYLAPGFNLDGPKPTANFVGRMLDGERPIGTRTSNRVISLPVVIKAPTRALVANAREVLIRAISQPHFTLTWTRDQWLPLVFDCYQSEATVVDYDLKHDRANVSNIAVAFTAHPFGRSDVPSIIEAPTALAGKTAPPAPVLIDDFSTAG